MVKKNEKHHNYSLKLEKPHLASEPYNVSNSYNIAALHISIRVDLANRHFLLCSIQQLSLTFNICNQ
jgi:hypothetical protein